jgi:hypothetical protein
VGYRKGKMEGQRESSQSWGGRNIVRPDQRQGEGRRKRATNGEAGEEEASNRRESLVEIGSGRGRRGGKRNSDETQARKGGEQSHVNEEGRQAQAAKLLSRDKEERRGGQSFMNEEAGEEVSKWRESLVGCREREEEREEGGD